MAKKDTRDLMIVESPNKVHTIQQFVGNDIEVVASVGHITKINDSGLYNLGIDIDNNFKPDFVVDEGKKDIVKSLKEKVKNSGLVYIATDPDRPRGWGYCISLKGTIKNS